MKVSELIVCHLFRDHIKHILIHVVDVVVVNNIHCIVSITMPKMVNIICGTSFHN